MIWLASLVVQCWWFGGDWLRYGLGFGQDLGLGFGSLFWMLMVVVVVAVVADGLGFGFGIWILFGCFELWYRSWVLFEFGLTLGGRWC